MKKVLLVATVVQMHINVFHLPMLKMFQEKGYKTYVAASNDTGSRKAKNENAAAGSKNISDGQEWKSVVF